VLSARFCMAYRLTALLRGEGGTGARRKWVGRRQRLGEGM
jgi:hypothetical protein